MKTVNTPSLLMKSRNQQINELALFYILSMNQSAGLNLSEQELEDKILATPDSEFEKIADIDNHYTLLVTALRYKKEQNLQLSEKSWQTLIEKNNYSQLTQMGRNPFMLYAYQRKRQDICLPEYLLTHLLKNSIYATDIPDVYKNNNFSIACFCYQEENLALTPEHWQYLIDSVSPSHVDRFGLNAFTIALRYQRNIQLDFSQLQQLHQKCGYGTALIHRKDILQAVEAAYEEYERIAKIKNLKKQLERECVPVQDVNLSNGEMTDKNKISKI